MKGSQYRRTASADVAVEGGQDLDRGMAIIRLSNENRGVLGAGIHPAPRVPHEHMGPARRRPWARIILPGVVIGILCAIVALVHIQHWPYRYNPPGMDLSRRTVFALASVLELLGAGIIGFAFGLGASDHRHVWRHPGFEAGPSSSKRGAVLVICGFLITIIASHYEYLSLTDKMP